MKQVLFFILLLFSSQVIKAQSLYFPPITGNTWDTIAPTQLGWCPDKIDTLLQFLDEHELSAPGGLVFVDLNDDIDDVDLDAGYEAKVHLN